MTAARLADGTGTQAAAPPGPIARAAAWLVLGCVALAAASLAAPWALAFDPQAWVVWGRDLLDGALDTSPGPSWKPLPVVFTAPFQAAGDAAPALWVVVARASGLLALAGTWRLASRVGGPVAGAAAAAALALSPWWLFNTALGNSEGMLVAAVVWAVDAHLAGRPRAALALGTAAALLRPEVWPFLGAYGVWLWRAQPAARGLVAGVAVIVPALWFGPDVTGAGGALTASDAARGTATPGSAQNADVPFAAVLWDAVELLTVPAVLAGGAALVRAGRMERWLAAGAAGYVVLVAVMTQAGYAGNPRYLVPAAGLGCVLAGVGAARLARARWAGPLVLAAAVAAVTAGDLADQVRQVGERADRRRALDVLVARAGGAEAIRSCAPVRTAGFARALVAWRLDVRMNGLGRRPAPPAAVLRIQVYDGAAVLPPPDPRFRVRARADGWEYGVSCRP